MGKLHRLQPVAVALLLAFLLSSCSGMIRTPRDIFRKHKRVTGTSPALKVATREELNAIIAHAFDSVDSFTATCSLTASSGSVYEGKVVDYVAIPGHILFRKPYDIRIQATIPFAGTLAVDLVSNGTEFRFLRGNLFVKGLNSATASPWLPCVTVKQCVRTSNGLWLKVCQEQEEGHGPPPATSGRTKWKTSARRPFFRPC